MDDAAEIMSGSVPPPSSLDRAMAERDRLTLHWVSGLGAVMFPFAAIFIPLLGPWTAVKAMLMATLPLGFAASAWAFLRSKSRERFSDSVQRLVIVGIAPAVFFNTAYFGLYSPALLILFLYLYVASLATAKLGQVMYFITAAGHATAAYFLIGREAELGSLVQLSVSGSEAVVGEVLTQSVLFAGFVIGRGARRSSQHALEQLHLAQVEAARRDVVAREAAAQLRKAQGPAERGYLSGETLGDFVLGRVLGRGGMGEVYEGRRASGDDVAAVKVLSPLITQSDSAMKRFERECRVLAGLDHANIVRLLASGTSEAGLPYLAMELLHGHNLADQLRSKPALNAEEALQLISEVAAGLDHAHGQALVHRDLKPENLFWDDSQRRWKILDFGIAKSIEGEQASLTQGYIIGTPAYMAPEHAAGQPLDHRADIYALTAIAYRVLTGFPVFSAQSPAAMVRAVVYEHPRPPSTLADLHLDVDRALAIGLAKSPDARFSSALELAEALRASLDGNLDDALRKRGEALIATWHTSPQQRP